jgi:BirA family biotin operon repressor/biotin-[acetyl-CoA-carboxylase] ligase
MIGAMGETTVEGLVAGWPRELVDVPLLALARVDSTQRLARAYLEKLLGEGEAPSPFLVAALEQTAGRGRRGRSWASAPGLGVWATLVIAVEPERLPSVPMRAGVGLADVAEAVAPDVRLKWPNDLVHQGRKLGGLLVDVVARGDDRAWALVGFGVDCFHTEDQLPERAATSLALAAGAAPPPLAALLPRFASALLDRLLDGEGWLDRYCALSAHTSGDPIACEVEGKQVEGRFAGFDAHGFLRLESASGEVVLPSGSVFSW